MTHIIPTHFRHTRATPFWDRTSVPQALLTHHNTRQGVYGRLSVMRGAVRYLGFRDEQATEPEMRLEIHAGEFGISPPGYWHRIELLTEDTLFNIDFFADPNISLDGEGVHQVVHIPA